MSLWLESLSLCLYDSGDDLESKTKCILSHLSMDIPRSWWEKALETNSIRDSHASILHDLLKDLLKISRLDGEINSGILVALAFADKKGTDPTYGSVDSPYSIEEYLDKAKKILIDRPELSKLGILIDNAEK